MDLSMGVGGGERAPVGAWGSRVRVTVRDGTVATLQPLTPADRDLYLVGFEHLGSDSRLMRFLGPKPSLSEREIRYFTDVDHHDHEAIAAIVAGQGVGVARYIRDPSRPGTADVAVAVVDAWQRRGIGTALMRRIAERARDEGIIRLRATMLADNRAMFATLRALHASWRSTGATHGVVDIEIRIEGVAA